MYIISVSFVVHSLGAVPCTHDGALSVKIAGDAPSDTDIVVSPSVSSRACLPFSEASIEDEITSRPVVVSGGGAMVMPSSSPRKYEA